MGDYTRFELTVVIHPTAPAFVETIIKGMMDDDGRTLALPDHPFFSTPRWMMVMGCGSAYHPTERSNLFREAITAEGSENTQRPLLHLRISSSFKNYDNEIALFLDWISPYLVPAPGICGFIDHYTQGFQRHCSIITLVAGGYYLIPYRDEYEDIAYGKWLLPCDYSPP